MENKSIKMESPEKALKDLDVLSIEALDEYIMALEAEIGRARHAILNKKNAKIAADGIFKT